MADRYTDNRLNNLEDKLFNGYTIVSVTLASNQNIVLTNTSTPGIYSISETVIDGINLIYGTGQRIFLVSQTSTIEKSIYIIVGQSPFLLQKADDFNTLNKMDKTIIQVESGKDNAQNQWKCNILTGAPVFTKINDVIDDLQYAIQLGLKYCGIHNIINGLPTANGSGTNGTIKKHDFFKINGINTINSIYYKDNMWIIANKDTPSITSDWEIFPSEISDLPNSFNSYSTKSILGVLDKILIQDTTDDGKIKVANLNNLPIPLLVEIALNDKQSLIKNGVNNNFVSLNNNSMMVDSGISIGNDGTNNTIPTSATMQNYVTQVVLNAPSLPPIDYATTSNIVTFSGLGTIDGYVPTSGKILLVKNQTNGDNSAWLVSSGAWTRAYNNNGVWSPITTQTTYQQLNINGGIVNVLNGTVNQNLQYQFNIVNPSATFGNSVVYVTSQTKLPIVSDTNIYADSKIGNNTNNNGSQSFPVASLTRALSLVTTTPAVINLSSNSSFSDSLTFNGSKTNITFQGNNLSNNGGLQTITGQHIFGSGSSYIHYINTVHSTGAIAPFNFVSGSLCRNIFQNITINSSATDWLGLNAGCINFIRLNNITFTTVGLNAINLPSFTNPFTIYIENQNIFKNLLLFTGTGASTTEIIIDVGVADGLVRIPSTYLGKITWGSSAFSNMLGSTAHPIGIINSQSDLNAVLNWTTNSTYDGYYAITGFTPNAFTRGAIFGKQTLGGITITWWARTPLYAPSTLRDNTKVYGLNLSTLTWEVVGSGGNILPTDNVFTGINIFNSNFLLPNATYASGNYTPIVIDSSGNLKKQPPSATISATIIAFQNTPPVSPNDGDSYIVGTNPTGAWLNKANNITQWNGADWGFITPTTNTIIADVAGNAYQWNGTTWIPYTLNSGTVVTQNISISTTLLVWNTVIYVNAIGTNITITLPAISSTNSGNFITIKRVDNNLNLFVRVIPNGSNTIDGQSSINLPYQYNSLTLNSDGNSTARITSDVNNGFGNNMSWLQAFVHTQTTGFANNSPILFGNNQSLAPNKLFGNAIKFLGNGQFELQPGNTYRLIANIGTVTGSGNISIECSWWNVTNNVPIQGGDLILTQNNAIPYSSNPMSFSYITPSVKTVIEYRMFNLNGTITLIGDGSGFSGANTRLSYCSIEQISSLANIVNVVQSCQYIWSTNQSIQNAGTMLKPNVLVNSSSQIPYNSTTGGWTLTPGCTYRLESNLPGIDSNSNVIWCDADKTSANLLVNSNFGSATGWILGNGANISGGLLNCNGCSAIAYQNNIVVAGNTYCYTYTYTKTIGANLRLETGGPAPATGGAIMPGTVQPIGASGTITGIFVANATGNIGLAADASAFTGSISSFGIFRIAPLNNSPKTTANNKFLSLNYSPTITTNVGLVAPTTASGSVVSSVDSYVSILQLGSTAVAGLPSQQGTSGKFLKSNGITSEWTELSFRGISFQERLLIDTPCTVMNNSIGLLETYNGIYWSTNAIINILAINPSNFTTAGLYTVTTGTLPTATSGAAIGYGDIFYFNGATIYYQLYNWAVSPASINVYGAKNYTLVKGTGTNTWIPDSSSGDFTGDANLIYNINNFTVTAPTTANLLSASAYKGMTLTVYNSTTSNNPIILTGISGLVTVYPGCSRTFQSNGTIWYTASQNVVITAPNANVYFNGSQSVIGGQFNIVQFQSKQIDTNGCYNNTGSTVLLNNINVPAWSFCPNVPGYYQVNTALLLTNGNNEIVLAIYRNGVKYKQGTGIIINAGPSAFASSFSGGCIFLNGLGDYIQVGVFTTTNATIASGLDVTFMDIMFVNKGTI